MLDDITQAVLAREEVARYLRGGHGQTELEARERIHAYLDELRTTQRYPIYRALKHPLYPILRKIERIDEHVDIAQQATRAGRVIYISNHKSHLDYLVEPLVLDDNGIRPPVIAAGINLFGGPLGLIHRHVTGAIPIRRNTKDPAYLVTLKAYVAELLQRHDLLFYIEGGRSYSGELKTPKTGLLHAAMQADAQRASSSRWRSPTTWCSRITSSRTRPGSGRGRPFAREVAEMVRYAVGYQSRAFVTFGEPISLDGIRSRVAARRDGPRAPDHATRSAGSTRSLPTAVLAAALQAVDYPARARGPRRGDHRNRPRRRRATWASRPDDRRSRREPSRWPRATSSTSSEADVSGYASEPCSATTPALFSISSRE